MWRTNVRSVLSQSVSDRVHELVQKFVNRTERFKERAVQPPTPSTSDADATSGVSDVESPTARGHRLDSFMPPSALPEAGGPTSSESALKLCGRWRLPRAVHVCHPAHSIDPNSNFYLCWILFVSIAFLYNAAASPLRTAFARAPIYNASAAAESTEPDSDYDDITSSRAPSTNDTIWNMTSNASSSSVASGYPVGRNGLPIIGYFPGYETPENRIYWWIIDYTCDVIYLLDILLVKRKLRFINNGMLETDPKVISRNYMTTVNFKFDVLSLLPLDIFYLIPSANYCSLLRLPRVLKIQTFWEFYDRLDQRVSSAHIVRVARTMTYMFFLIHLETCGYFGISASLGLGTDDWVYSGMGIAYLRCMYLASKTATSIGNNAEPTQQEEFLFMIFYWLLGIFVFAMLIGQIRDIFQAADANRDRYRKTIDQTIYYMKSLNVPKELQERVRMWFTYNWEHSKTLDENSLLEALPKKMKTDLAIHVHFNTLSKVNLFQDCDKNLLYDLVLKLKPVLFLPGDYICRKGEVGTEMYIVMMGQVEVVGGPNNNIVFATLHEGSVFGEISLLALAGGNRRTADVRSKGFSQLFLLSKADFEEAMREYPDVQKILRKKAKKLLAQNRQQVARHMSVEADEVIKSRPGTPKLLRTVIRVVNEDSHIPDYLGMRRRSSNQPQHLSSSAAVAATVSPPEIIELGVQHPPVSFPSDEFDEVLVIEQTEIDIPIAAAAAEQMPSPELSVDELMHTTEYGDVQNDNPAEPVRSPSNCSVTEQPWSESGSLGSGLLSIMDMTIHNPDQSSVPPCPNSPASRLGVYETDDLLSVAAADSSSSRSTVPASRGQAPAKTPCNGHIFPLKPPPRNTLESCRTASDDDDGADGIFSCTVPECGVDLADLFAGRCSVDVLTAQRQYLTPDG